MTSDARLELQNVFRMFSHSRGGSPIQALAGISLCVKDGEFVCLLGRSGCGKSTILALLAGLDQPSAGRVLCNGSPVTGPAPDRMLMFQEAALFPWLNVLENILFGLKHRKEWPAAERKDRALAWLETVGLADFANFRIHELSGGMRQRVALARALAPDPQVLLMDEPFSALDAMTRESLYGDLQLIWEQTNKTIVMVTHNVREAVCLGSRILLMASGPGRVVDDIPVPLAHPRNMNSVELARLATLVSSRLQIHANVSGVGKQSSREASA